MLKSYIKKNIAKALNLSPVNAKLDMLQEKLDYTAELENIRQHLVELQNICNEQHEKALSKLNGLWDIRQQLIELQNICNEQHGEALCTLNGLGDIQQQLVELQKIRNEQHQEALSKLNGLGDIRQQLSELHKILHEQRDEAQNSYVNGKQLKNILEGQCHTLNKLVENINYQKTFFNNTYTLFSRNFEISDWELSILNNYYQYLTNFNLKRLYSDLVKNIDNESKKTVEKIINIILNIPNTRNLLNYFTQDDINNLILMDKNFRAVQLNDNCWVWMNHYLPINHFEACVYYYNYGLDHVENIDKLKNLDIIDAGAFIGDSASIFSPLAKRVIAFEPIRSNYCMLLQTISLNEIDNVIPINMALGMQKCETEINVCGSASGNLMQSERKEKVYVTSLDEYCKDHEVEIGLIKSDLEGSDFEFLKGAEQCIRKFHPILLVSIYHTPEDFFKIKPWLESLDLGYKFKIVKPLDGQAVLETCLIAQ